MILFLRREYERFEDILDKIDDIEECSKIYIADFKQFEAYKQAIQQVAKKHNVRNIGAIMSKIMDIIEEHLQNRS